MLRMWSSGANSGMGGTGPVPVILMLLLCWLTGGTLPSAAGQFAHENVKLIRQITLSEFGEGAKSGNDCWGYVSPTGREYALMGLFGKTAFVEITDPANPVVVAEMPHAGSDWSDIKVYREFAYVCNEGGQGTQVLDLSGIDAGVVTLVRTLHPLTSHNLVLNEESGMLYLVGSRSISGGLLIFDLKPDPSNPEYLGNWHGSYVHDAQIVVMKRAPYQGREVAFCCSPNAFRILDITDKSQMVTLSISTYPDISYCHQGWLSADQRFFYLNDENDEIRGKTATTRTILFDVTNLRKPVYLGSFSTGFTSTDHNLYVTDNFIFEANYRSGLHIFDASDPVAPRHVGYFDTYPRNDRPGYDGAWGVYPFFPSGTVIVSDIEEGLFILDVSEALGVRRVVLETPVLRGGEEGMLHAGNAGANAETYFVYSLAGPGALYLPSVNALLGLTKPKLAGMATADGNGDVSLKVVVPAKASGLEVWFQAISDGRTSNVPKVVVN